MKLTKIIGATVAVAIGLSGATSIFAMTTSRTEPMKLTDKEYTYSAFFNDNVLLDKKNGRLPAMGWNSWNAFGSGNTEALTKAMADKIIELGLDDLGYEYMVLDDGCYKSTRVNGKLANNEKFPSGFKALSDYMHERGLKFGMYNDIGTNLCAGAEVGTCGYEDVDAQTYIDWGVDFLKVDNCYYLWDNATFSDKTNAKYTYVPNIRSITVTGENLNQTLNAVTDGTLTGRGASKNTSGNFVTNIGTYDGTNVGNTPYGDQSGELMFKVTAPADGEYKITVNYASGTEIGKGQWLQLAVGDVQNETRYFDDILEASSDFTDSDEITVNLNEGENVIRLMNHRRQENTLYSYAALLDGLNKADPNNDVLLSICEWGKTQPQDWGYKVGSSWRILNDISFILGNTSGNPGKGAWKSNDTASITSQYSKAVIMDEYAGLDRGWNDPDMFVIGMNDITPTMGKTHMSMWCMMNSPLMLGLDLRRVQKGDDIYNIIANKDMIDLNQDALGVQAKRIYCSLTNNPDTDYVTNIARTDILAKPLANGDVALSFINVNNAADNTKHEIDVNTIVEYIGSKMINANEFKTAKGYYVKDLWTKEEYMTSDKTFSVNSLDACDSVTLRISPIYDDSTMKNILGEKIEYAKTVLENKSDSGKKLLQDANNEYGTKITSAETVYNNASSDMNAYKTAYDELSLAEETLNNVYEKYNLFGDFIAECEAVKNTADRYEQNNAWNDFVTCLETAHGVYDNPQTIAELDMALSALDSAKKKIRRALGDGLNPIAWYVFDTENGTADITGNGNTAKLVNTGAKISESSTLSLNQNNENNGYMELPSGLLSNTENFAVTAWVKQDEVRSWARIFDFGTSSQNGYMFLCPYNGGKLTAYAITASDNTAEQTVTTTPIAANEWVHVAVVQDGGTAKIYVDGKAVSSGNVTNNPKNSIGAVAKHYIGKSQFNDPYFKGEIMDLRVYDKSLSDDDIKTVMADFDPDPEIIPSISIHPDFYATYDYADNHDDKLRTLNTSVTNITKETQTVQSIFAAYNDDGSLKDVKMQSKDIEAGKKYVFTENAYTDDTTRVFVWDKDMQPIIEAIDASPYTEPETVWEIVRKNEDNISYTAGNSLTIKTERGDLWATADGRGTAENLYLTELKGDFDVNVTVKFKPSVNYQRGALIAYTGDGNHVTVMRRYHSAYNGNVFMTTMNTNGKAADESKYTADTASDSCVLRLVRSGSTFKGYFSTDNGTTWNELETRVQNVLGASETIKVGFYASNGDEDADSADVIFENFTINGKTVTFNNAE